MKWEAVVLAVTATVESGGRPSVFINVADLPSTAISGSKQEFAGGIDPTGNDLVLHPDSMAQGKL